MLDNIVVARGNADLWEHGDTKAATLVDQWFQLF